MVPEGREVRAELEEWAALVAQAAWVELVAQAELAAPIVRRNYLPEVAIGSIIRSIVAEHHIEIGVRRTALGGRLEEIRWETGRRVPVSKLAAREAIWQAIGVVVQESVIALRGLEGAIVLQVQVQATVRQVDLEEEEEEGERIA